LERDTLLASRTVDNEQKKDIQVLVDKLKEEESRSEQLNNRLI